MTCFVRCSMLLLVLLLLLLVWWTYAWHGPESCRAKDAPLAASSSLPQFLQRNSIDFVSPPTPQAYSSHVCLGGENEFGEINWFHRRCVFTNLVFHKNYFIYHKHPNQVRMDLPPQREFAKFFPAVLHVKNEPIPSYMAQQKQQRVKGDENCLIVAHENKLAAKPGHDFDSIWNAFNAMLAMRVLDFNNQVVLVSDLEQPLAISKWWATLTHRFMRWEDFAPGHANTFHSCVLFANRHEFDVTFPTFVDAYAPQLYRQRALAILQLTPPPPRASAAATPRPNILVRFKTRTHGFTNHTALVKFLRTTYPTCVINVLNGTRESDLKQEVLSILSADVYITPGGGGSFSGIFVRPGVTVIYGNTCWRGLSPLNKHDPEEFGLNLIHRNGRHIYCFRQDNFVWTLFNHYEKRYLSATDLADIAFPEVDTALPYNRALRHSFMPNFAELTKFVDQALLRSRHHASFATSRTTFTTEALLQPMERKEIVLDYH